MPLTAAQLARLSPLLDEALPLDEAARRRWLEALPSEYEDLAPVLWRSLLPEASEAAGVDKLAMLPKFDSVNGSGGVTASGLQPGARVGPYELIRLLGAGGMAEVWLARRADGAFKREVALKLPLLTRMRKDLEQRFIRERDILASLEHPQIARLYDAGVDSKGLPYLSMEYVQGQPLTSWCDEKRLGIPERLALILQVLNAVQYAHENHVIHRDLKPSNILVTDSGHVRLLDFGVAQLLEEDEAAAQQELTSAYGRALTPDFASPELLRGDPVDARSDVYSLGVLLYELLTGVRPYRLKSAASVGMVEQANATTEVQRPSTQCDQQAIAARGTTPEKLSRQLRGDLDAIVLKALAKEPAERYPSAATLAEDVRRYLDGQPIQALPARFTDRLRKFVRRNKHVVTVAAIAGGGILAAVALLVWGPLRQAPEQLRHGATPESLITVGAEVSSPLMAKVRDATEPYKDVNVAIAAGFVQGTMCVNVDGALGIYFVQSDLIGGSGLDVNQPQALSYEPLSNGSLRLVGAEYIVLASVWTKQHPGANPPALEGQPLNLVETPIGYRRADFRHGLSAFYELNVLAWEHNPVGTFADWSTGISCVQQPS